MKEYNISFSEAINLLLEGKWLRGQNFKLGVYIKLDLIGQLVLVDTFNSYKETPYAFIRSLVNQKYRIITFATVKELTD
jgi:hypothetical protein